MADINPIIPGSPAIPPVGKEREVGRRVKREQDDEKQEHPAEEDSGSYASNQEGIDYYA